MNFFRRFICWIFDHDIVIRHVKQEEVRCERCDTWIVLEEQHTHHEWEDRDGVFVCSYCDHEMTPEEFARLWSGDPDLTLDQETT